MCITLCYYNYWQYKTTKTKKPDLYQTEHKTNIGVFFDERYSIPSSPPVSRPAHRPQAYIYISFIHFYSWVRATTTRLTKAISIKKSSSSRHQQRISHLLKTTDCQQRRNKSQLSPVLFSNQKVPFGWWVVFFLFDVIVLIRNAGSLHFYYKNVHKQN